MISLPDVARGASLSQRQLHHWIRLGLVRAVRLDRSAGRHYWYIREEDEPWVRSLASLVRLGVSVETIAQAAHEGRLRQMLADLARFSRTVRPPEWLRVSEARDSVRR